MKKNEVYEKHELDFTSDEENLNFEEDDNNNNNDLEGFEIDEKSDFEEDEEEKDDDDDDDEEIKSISSKNQNTVELTNEVVKEIENDLKNSKVLNFESICPLIYALKSVTFDEKNPTRIIVTEPELAKRIIIMAFTFIPEYVSGYGINNNNNNNNNNNSSSVGLKKISKISKMFFSDSLRQLEDISSADEETLIFGLQQIQKIIKNLQVFPKLSKIHFKLLLKVWSTNLSMQARVVAFAGIIDLAKTYSKRYLIPSLKGTYLSFSKVSRITNHHTILMLTFMIRCAAELYLIDNKSKNSPSYVIAFKYIRQLSVHLRNAITLKEKDNLRVVYSWQFIQSLKFWTNIIVTNVFNQTIINCNSSKNNEGVGLNLLVYPLVQILIGTLQLQQSSIFHPLHLNILSQLSDIVSKCKVFIPLVPFYSSILSSVVSRPAKPSTLKQLHLSVFLRCPKPYVGTTVYCSQISQSVQLGILEYSANLSNTIAFPEISAIICSSLKHVSKKSLIGGGGGLTRQLQSLVIKIEESAKITKSKRSAIDLSPADIKEIKQFEKTNKLEKSPLQKHWESVQKVEKIRSAEIAESYFFTGNDNEEEIENNKNKKSKSNFNNKKSKRQKIQ